MEESLSVFDISGSALTAQRIRMSVLAANIAHANSVATPDGEPYRRREVVFSTALQEAVGDDREGAGLGGVEVLRIAASKEPFKTVYDPQHPLADEKGFVRMPNVDVMRETVQMVAAQRAYDANLSALKAYRDILRNSISILRG